MFEENTLFGNLCLDVPVGAATYSESDRAGGCMTRQTDHPYVVYQIFTPELSSDSALTTDFQHLLFPFKVAERPTALVSRGRQMVEVSGRSLLHRSEVHLGRCSPDDQRQMVRRTCRCSQIHNVSLDEFGQRLLVEQRFGLLIEERLVGRTASLCNKQEAVLIPLRSIQIDLSRQVRSGIFLLGHGKRNHL